MEDTKGIITPHGEVITIREFFSDKETDYAPSVYFVYDVNLHTKEFIDNISPDSDISSFNPEMEILHTPENKLKGYDKVGSLLFFNNNRGWWCGSIFDECDASMIFEHKLHPTVIQVAAGAYSGLLWLASNPNSGNKWSEELDTDFILEHSAPYLGRIWSYYVDLSKTHFKIVLNLKNL